MPARLREWAFSEFPVAHSLGGGRRENCALEYPKGGSAG